MVASFTKGDPRKRSMVGMEDRGESKTVRRLVF